jgi:hypothetical protein
MINYETAQSAMSEPSESLDQSAQSNKETLKRGGNLPTQTASELEEKLPKSLPLGDYRRNRKTYRASAG